MTLICHLSAPGSRSKMSKPGRPPIQLFFSPASLRCAGQRLAGHLLQAPAPSAEWERGCLWGFLGQGLCMSEGMGFPRAPSAVTPPAFCTVNY